MSVQVKRRRDTAANIAGFTPAQGEIIVDTTNNRMIVGDGVTAGGWAAPKLAGDSFAGSMGFPFGLSVGGSAANVGSASRADLVARFPTLDGQAGAAFAWNYIAGSGETDLFINRDGGSVGGLAIFDFPNTSGSPVKIFQVNGSGNVNIPGGFTSGSAGYTFGDGTTQATAIGPNPLATLATGPYGSAFKVGVLEQSVTLSGATTTAGINIPNGCILLGVGCYVKTAVTGATSFNVGDSGAGDAYASPTRFGSCGIAAGSSSAGVIGPIGIYSATPIVITSVGGSFTGGVLHLATFYVQITPPTS